MAKTDPGLSQVLADADLYRLPRVVAFNRLEARPRTTDFTRSLRAEVRDPLWMLTRQWQFGEFQGEDAASPVTARIAYRHDPIDRVALGDGDAAPLRPGDDAARNARRARADAAGRPRERRTARSSATCCSPCAGESSSCGCCSRPGLDGHYALYLNAVPDPRPGPEPPAGGPPRVADDGEAEQLAVAVRRPRRRRRRDLARPWSTARTTAGSTASSAATTLRSRPLAATFAGSCSAAVDRLFTQPEGAEESAWVRESSRVPVRRRRQPANRTHEPGRWRRPVRRRAVSTGTRSTSSAIGALPLDGEPRARAAGRAGRVVHAGARALQGAAASRASGRWKRPQTDFGKIETSATGLLHLMLAEFGLIYSNDWFMLPHPMDVNTVCEIRGIVVDDTFGRHTFIRAGGPRARRRPGSASPMFHLTERGSAATPATASTWSPPSAKCWRARRSSASTSCATRWRTWPGAIESIVPSQTGVGHERQRNQSRPAPPSPNRPVGRE